MYLNLKTKSEKQLPESLVSDTESEDSLVTDADSKIPFVWHMVLTSSCLERVDLKTSFEGSATSFLSLAPSSKEASFGSVKQGINKITCPKCTNEKFTVN